MKIKHISLPDASKEPGSKLIYPLGIGIRLVFTKQQWTVPAESYDGKEIYLAFTQYADPKIERLSDDKWVVE